MAIAVRHILKATGKDVIVVTPTGCLETFTSPLAYARNEANDVVPGILLIDLLSQLKTFADRAFLGPPHSCEGFIYQGKLF